MCCAQWVCWRAVGYAEMCWSTVGVLGCRRACWGAVGILGCCVQWGVLGTVCSGVSWGAVGCTDHWLWAWTPPVCGRPVLPPRLTALHQDLRVGKGPHHQLLPLGPS